MSIRITKLFYQAQWTPWRFRRFTRFWRSPAPQGPAGKLEGSSDNRCREEPTMAASWWERGAVASTGGSARRQSEECSQELARLRCWRGMGLSVLCTVYSVQFTAGLPKPDLDVGKTTLFRYNNSSSWFVRPGSVADRHQEIVVSKFEREKLAKFRTTFQKENYFEKLAHHVPSNSKQRKIP